MNLFGTCSFRKKRSREQNTTASPPNRVFMLSMELQNGPKTVFQNRNFRIWQHFSRYKFWKVCFSTAGCKHCCDTSFPDVPSSYEKLFPYNLLKDSQQGFHLESSMGNMKSRFGGLAVVCCSRDLFFLKEQVPKRFTCIYYCVLRINSKKPTTLFFHGRL